MPVAMCKHAAAALGRKTNVEQKRKKETKRWHSTIRLFLQTCQRVTKLKEKKKKKNYGTVSFKYF